jgi:preprotein translocase subunit SecF
MLRPLRPIADTPRIAFIPRRKLFFALSILASVASVALLLVAGLNFGIDFRGGILVEVRAKQAIDLGTLRSGLGEMGLGEVALQEFGEDTDVLVRLQRQEGDETAQQKAAEATKAKIAELLGADVEFRRVEFVGPQVSRELIEAGIIALVVAIAAQMIYIWVRFEWQFGIGAVLSLVHDVLLTMGLFSFLQLEFNLTIVAALLTIIGYSMNDTVVIFDRVRENLRKYKVMPVEELLNLSVNETLSRTVMTGGSTLLALLSLYLFGGEVINGFALAMIWGVVVGTYSSIYIAAPVLLYTGVRRLGREGAEATAEGGA